MNAHATDGTDTGTDDHRQADAKTSILRRAMADSHTFIDRLMQKHPSEDVPCATRGIGSGSIPRSFNLRPKLLPHMYARIRSASEFPGLRRSVKTPKVCLYIRGEMSPVVCVTGDRQTTSWVLGHARWSTKDSERGPLRRRGFRTRANFSSSLPTLQAWSTHSSANISGL